eukprot:CAMPEP_0198449942 /NCGR_PEP_ID=MMETSP1453-20131121/4668_1 /TAXON_ID=1461543 ORGANISM="Unidentified sp., Strain RCC701" /NCGR_SAMPLE_ID=MMETSP1453 /ASSEMBLY_ACC=CAM_ASM_001118 /LENGTH=49 /DNA_ID= /DNA_START= /DNA_END= /DNA_ORIENTATION=
MTGKWANDFGNLLTPLVGLLLWDSYSSFSPSARHAFLSERPQPEEEELP